jgi:hypothetical protein
VVAARWQKVLTPDQLGELQKMAKFVDPDPSRLPQEAAQPEQKAS